MTEKELELEFDRKYENGDFDDQQILDDDLPDFKDKWISEQETKEAFKEIDEASVDVVNALAHHKSLMGVITEAIKKTK